MLGVIELLRESASISQAPVEVLIQAQINAVYLLPLYVECTDCNGRQILVEEENTRY
jgi:hypothetical protein